MDTTMDEFGTCRQCGQYAWLPRHRCLPAWDAILMDDLEAADEFGLWQEVRARTADEAAENYARAWDQAEAAFAERARQVVVRSASGEVTFWEVTADLEPVYWAEPYTPEGEEDAP